MAHARTSIAQTLAQLGIGASLALVYYRSLARDTEQDDILEELDVESRTQTSGKHWGLENRVQEDATVKSRKQRGVANIDMMDFYPALRMREGGNGEMVVLQPWWNGKSAGQCLGVNLSTGSVLEVASELQTGRHTDVFGVLGMVRMKSTSALVVITAVKEVGKLRGFPVFLVQKTRVLSGPGGFGGGPIRGQEPSCGRGSVQVWKRNVHICRWRPEPDVPEASRGGGCRARGCVGPAFGVASRGPLAVLEQGFGDASYRAGGGKVRSCRCQGIF